MFTALGIGLMFVPLLATAALIFWVYWIVRRRHIEQMMRVFQEKPLFIIPRGDADPGAESLRLPTAGGQTLQAAYIKTKLPQRLGVIIFGIEFGSDRWSALPYCQALIDAGFDILVYEPRQQGQSDRIADYEPLQWLSEHEIADAKAALAYALGRPDADPRGVGWFGVSKGANAGLAIAPGTKAIRAVATDGAFGMISVIVPYMRHWVKIYNHHTMAHGLLPRVFYAAIARVCIKCVQVERKVRFYGVEPGLKNLEQPLLMIHGEQDSYIKEMMARELFERVKGSKEFWLVPRARHNQAIVMAPQEYAERVTSFFQRHLGQLPQ